MYRMVFLLVSVAVARARYYFAWKLGEAINNASGLGFNGWDTNGRAKWDLVNNVKIRKLEVRDNRRGKMLPYENPSLPVVYHQMYTMSS